MACEGCIEKEKRYHAKKLETIKEAQDIANESGEWVGIYSYNGNTWFAVGADTVGKPIERYLTPKKDL